MSIDDSKHSQKALEFVKQMKWPEGTRVLVVSAVREILPVYSEVYVPPASYSERLMDDLAPASPEVSLEREYAALDEVWQAEKAQLQGTQHIKEEIDKIKLQMEEARRKGDWQKMSELQYGKLPALEAQLKKADTKLAKEHANKPQLLRTQVGAEEIAEVVSRATGIPVSKMMQGERE